MLPSSTLTRLLVPERARDIEHHGQMLCKFVFYKQTNKQKFEILSMHSRRRWRLGEWPLPARPD